MKKPVIAVLEPRMDPTKPIFTPVELSQYLGVTHQCLANWRCRGEGPRFLRVGKRIIRYRWKDVEEWMERRSGQTDAELSAAGV